MDRENYPVIVESVGTFECRRRTLRVEIKIGAEFSRLTEGEEKIPAWFRELCEIVSALKCLIVKAPEGFSIDDMDAGKEDSFEKLVAVYNSIILAEARFRQGPENPT